MNEHMLEVKKLNLILTLLYMLILCSWSCFHIPVHATIDAQEKLQHGHRMELKIHLFKTLNYINI